ncbi:tripartite tricarboxylate transporter substrate binding protein [Falsiroseomonas tokyonensis]|uniref:Tripartite tricarboxylate transporter substrate binding protein n=1 Tax=Falsiroseomonas tokyonensis TaxID=430521 RepID=A0ABV7BZL1_9PROT|nr:tripartite tricarboxylate transporter substrate binding protein [Falsiroseomonas tokyonensis]MBU8540100.1 tripartite tricarboxylate transporter substrate binding protein [Falsiroseomonas tokyonensis]
MHKIGRRPLLAGLAGATLAAPALGQPAWPNGPIRIIVPFPPGGSVDTITRLLQPRLSAELGQPVVIENRPGASGALGTAAAARSAPDGNTWVTVFDSHAVNPSFISNLGFDAKRDLVPVMQIGAAPMLITTHNSRPWQKLEEVITAAKAAPDTITYGSIGVGSLSHLTMSLMQQRGGFKMVHVPYRGGGPMSAAAAAGELDLPMASNAGLGGQVGQSLRPLAQTGGRRSPLFPDLPTVAESGVPGIDAQAWWAVLGRAGTPEPILRRFHAALAKALEVPEVRARLANPMGVEIVASTPEDFGRFLDTQMETWAAVIRDNNIKPD